MQQIRYTYIIVILLLFSSCATKRTSKDIYQVSPELAFMINNFNDGGVKEWESGKKFVCVVDELPILLEPKSGTTEEIGSIKNQQFIYQGVEEQQNWSGIETFLIFKNGEGDEFIYRTKKRMSEILSTDFSPLLPELVSLDYVNLADSLLRGKTLYLKTSNWSKVDADEVGGQKLIPVVVEKVVAGNKIFPVAIIFKTNDKTRGEIYTTMNSSQSMSQYSSFDKLFSFSNPREKYQQITDEVWAFITKSEVSLGMTKDECKLSLGLPSKVNHIHEYSGLRERWSYNTGTYLEFKDGLLVNFRLM